MTDEELFIPVDWRDHGEADLALDVAEAAYAERCYLESHPPIPSEFVGTYTRAIPSLGEPAWPPLERVDLLFRCIFALRRINARDETYRFYRNIYTPEARQEARERRRSAKSAARDWREFGDRVALETMLECLEEIHAERVTS